MNSRSFDPERRAVVRRSTGVHSCDRLEANPISFVEPVEREAPSSESLSRPEECAFPVRAAVARRHWRTEFRHCEGKGSNPLAPIAIPLFHVVGNRFTGIVCVCGVRTLFDNYGKVVFVLESRPLVALDVVRLDGDPEWRTSRHPTQEQCKDAEGGKTHTLHRRTMTSRK